MPTCVPLASPAFNRLLHMVLDSEWKKIIDEVSTVYLNADFQVICSDFLIDSLFNFLDATLDKSARIL